jgi:hypothetical protein
MSIGHEDVEVLSGVAGKLAELCGVKSIRSEKRNATEGVPYRLLANEAGVMGESGGRNG